MLHGFFYFYKMRKLILIVVFTLYSGISYCQQTDTARIKYYAGVVREFKFFRIKDTLQVIVKEFIKNDAFCFSEGGIPYALIIGQAVNRKSRKVVSVLAICDENIYHVGDKLKIIQSHDPRIGTFNRVDFEKDTIYKNDKYLYILGSEYPAVWGLVVK